jgi:prepilin-type N-terminal cleavage/methylation domain-containing protein
MVHRTERGITLIELMIVLLILSLATTAMFALLFASFSAYWRGDVASRVQQGARVSVDRVARDLRQARRLITGATETVGATSVTFNTSCSPNPQISFALPHVAMVTLTNHSAIYDTDQDATGAVPYDGTYASYYLAGSSNSATPNATGPYLIRAAYTLVGTHTLTLQDVATNITGLSFSAGGSCPTTATREFTVTLTAFQRQIGQNVQSQTIVVDDVTLRNQ